MTQQEQEALLREVLRKRIERCLEKYKGRPITDALIQEMVANINSTLKGPVPYNVKYSP